MSTLPENEFDLEKLFLPAWAQEEPSSAKYAKYEGETGRPDRRDDRRGFRRPRREDGGGPRREGNRRQNDRGPSSAGGRPGPPGSGAPTGQRPLRGGGRFRQDRREERVRREPPPPLPEMNLSLMPEEKGVESLARQIKMTGRAYPLFDIARLILQKPERHIAVFSVKKNPEGKPILPLFVCALDDTLWLSEDEAVAHVMRKHFATFYQAERTATEPPKGKYTFVAQCGMSGVILGPPNHHDYQNQLRKLHSERFSMMPFEVYKSRVRIVRDEQTVKKWVDDQSWKTDYVCLNMPEPLKLDSMEAVEKHFRETHKENIIKPVETYQLGGAAARNLRSPELVRLVRGVTEDQRRFPLQIATTLSQQFASHGLQFFKVNKTITHVAVARPHYLDLVLTPVSEGVQRIVQYIDAHPKCTRRQLVETLVPSPAPKEIPVPPPMMEGTTEGQPAPAPAEPAGPTPEQTAVIADLHWLVHQGHVIEFANGTLETAKKPVPRPPKPEKQKPEAPTEAAAEGQTGTTPPAAEPAIPEQAPSETAANAEQSTAPLAAPSSTAGQEPVSENSVPAEPPPVPTMPVPMEETGSGAQIPAQDTSSPLPSNASEPVHEPEAASPAKTEA